MSSASNQLPSMLVSAASKLKLARLPKPPMACSKRAFRAANSAGHRKPQALVDITTLRYTNQEHVETRSVLPPISLSRHGQALSYISFLVLADSSLQAPSYIPTSLAASWPLIRRTLRRSSSPRSRSLRFSFPRLLLHQSRLPLLASELSFHLAPL